MVGVGCGRRQGVPQRVAERRGRGLLVGEPAGRGRPPGGRPLGAGGAGGRCLPRSGERAQPRTRVRRSGCNDGGRPAVLRRPGRSALVSDHGRRRRRPPPAHSRTAVRGTDRPLRRRSGHPSRNVAGVGRGATRRRSGRAPPGGGGRRRLPTGRVPGGRRGLRELAPSLSGRAVARLGDLGSPVHALGQLRGAGRPPPRGGRDRRDRQAAPGGRRRRGCGRTAAMVPRREPPVRRRPKRLVAALPAGAR